MTAMPWDAEFARRYLEKTPFGDDSMRPILSTESFSSSLLSSAGAPAGDAPLSVGEIGAS